MKVRSWRRKMMEGYIEAARWSSSSSMPGTGDDGDGELIPLDDDSLDLAPGQAAHLGFKVARWARGFMPALERAADLLENGQWDGWELVGHNAWLSQDGHGTGFWDRDALDVSVTGHLSETWGDGIKMKDLLHEAAKTIPESYGYIGDEGLVYFS